MKDRIKDYFDFTKKEQRGLIVLLGLIILSISLKLALPFIITENQYDISPFKEDVDKFLASADSSRQESVSWNDQQTKKEINDNPPLENFLQNPFYFDPNEITKEKWIEMGMPEKLVNNMMRYREKGGKFRDEEGFRKIYGMDESIVLILSPYLQFTNKKNDYPKYADSAKTSTKKYKADKPGDQATCLEIIELNSADSAALLRLSGIGPTYAGKIIKYRELLGGYNKAGQLLEIRGMDSARFKQFFTQITIDTTLIRKIDLNVVTFKDLLRHPYFEYYLVKEIFKKKDEIKRFESLEQVRNIPVMYDELFLKIGPYLQTNK